MNANDQTIFQTHEDWWHNACIQNFSVGFSQLARYYLQSADALIERTVDDDCKLDVYVYAAVFLYRHSVELLLKELIWRTNFLLGRGKSIPRHHRLIELWQVLRSNTCSLLPSHFPLTREEVHAIETLFLEIGKHDPESDAFRYPFDKRMKRSHPEVMHINVRTLRNGFNQIHDYLGRIFYLVEFLYDAQSAI